MDVSKLKRLRSCFGCGRVGVFGRAKEPEEGNNDQVNDVAVGGAIFWVCAVKDGGKGSQDGCVDWVGSAWRVVVVLESFEESSVYGMELVGSKAFPRVNSTQVGDALGHGE